jgi:hypothetical protein
MLPFLAPLMLIGLAGVSIPIIIHLLNRRRYEVVDWGAMQFLQLSEAVRRRLMLEELLLLLLRMGLIAVLVLGLAGPFFESSVLSRFGGGNRDIVLIFDGSSSMTYTGSGKPADELAKDWATEFVNGLSAGDSVAVLQAKQQVVPLVASPSHDLQRVRQSIKELPAPAGGCDWPLAVQTAHSILAKSGRTQRDIIIVSDGQKFGWADQETLLRWELLANKLRDDAGFTPRIWVVNVAPERPPAPPNWSLKSVKASRAVAAANQLVTFTSGLEIRGKQRYEPPYALHVEIDGKSMPTDLKAPLTVDEAARDAERAEGEKNDVPLTFHYRFTTPGSHLLTVVVEPDPPAERRPAGYIIKDQLPGDNRQEFAIEVLSAIPVLLVDGDEDREAKQRGTDFLRDALAPARDLTPTVHVKVLSVAEFDAGALTTSIGKEPGEKPRVLILSNVARLSAEQQEAIATFLAAGGGVLITAGSRCELKHYNDDLLRNGQSWLPGRLDELAGDEAQPARGASPMLANLEHPALDLFRPKKDDSTSARVGGLGDARFPRWWKASVLGRNSNSIPIALFNNNDPFLIEKPFRNGRVILSTVPLDKTWRSNLPELPAFVPLAHELVYYLAGARGAEHNLQPGQPLRYRADSQDNLDALTLQTPLGGSKPLRFEIPTEPNAYPAQLMRHPLGAFVVYEGTRETGVYRVSAGEQTTYFTVQPDPRESDLTPSGEADRVAVSDAVKKQVTLQYENDTAAMLTAMTHTTQKIEVWWILLAGVIVLLCGEVLMTRWLVKRQ